MFRLRPTKIPALPWHRQTHIYFPFLALGGWRWSLHRLSRSFTPVKDSPYQRSKLLLFFCWLFLFSELRYSHNSTTTTVGKHALHTVLTNSTDKKKKMRLTDHQSLFRHVRGGRDQPVWQRRWGKGWRRRGTSQRWTKTRSACKQHLSSLHVYSQHVRARRCMCVCVYALTIVSLDKLLHCIL